MPGEARNPEPKRNGSSSWQVTESAADCDSDGTRVIRISPLPCCAASWLRPHVTQVIKESILTR